MATLTIRNLDDKVKNFLRVQAAANGRSMEAEVRAILEATQNRNQSRPEDIANRIHTHFARLGGIDLPVPDRAPSPPPIDFS